MDRGYYWHLVGRSWAWSSQPIVHRHSIAPSKGVLTPGSLRVQGPGQEGKCKHRGTAFPGQKEKDLPTT